MFKKSFPLYRQKEESDCGATCLQMIAKYHGKYYSLPSLQEKMHMDQQGASLKGISDAAEGIGLQTLGVKLTYEGTEEESGLLDVELPCIAYWNNYHYVVIYKANAKRVWVADPALGKVKYSKKKFIEKWKVKGEVGILLLLYPTPKFYAREGDEVNYQGFSHILGYIKPYRRLFGQVGLGLLVRVAFSVLFPFLTQAVVDIGIANQDISFILLVLIAQVMLYISSVLVNVLRSWIFLHVGTRVSFALIYDFLNKLVKLPLSFFYRKQSGEILQRIREHERVNAFLSNTSIDVIFSVFSLIIFSFILMYYSMTIFAVFWASSVVYIAWILVFLKRRKKIDYDSFKFQAINQSKLIEIIDGIQELKLQNSERKRLWQWAVLQGQIFRVNIRSLTLNQMQGLGADFINQLKNIFIIFLAARAVVNGTMTLGMMLATQYIIGQINTPLSAMINFIQSFQDAKLSLERIGRVNEEKEEEVEAGKVQKIPPGDIIIENLYFRYHPEQDYVLKDISCTIPRNKITAVVGQSGSGKTTLVKVLLGFFTPNRGSVKIGHIELESIANSSWRNVCGAVMQESYLFSDTIANNVVEGADTVDIERLYQALELVNLNSFLKSLPSGMNTEIGTRGGFLSQGQKQRILMARAIYKDPSFIFLDEATNSLDAYNEKVIMENLNSFYEGRTALVVAHRLSTVKNADQIIVVEDGRIAETGTHQELISQRGAYYTLVNNQLTLEL